MARGNFTIKQVFHVIATILVNHSKINLIVHYVPYQKKPSRTKDNEDKTLLIVRKTI